MKHANRLYLSLLFVLIYLGQIYAQAYKTDSSGFECFAIENIVQCEKCRGKGEYGQSSTPKITCEKCAGVSNEVLLSFPCGDCSNTRLVADSNYVPPKKCEPCSGDGLIFTLGHKFQVADIDYTKVLSFINAQYVTGAFGNGWRLPTKGELLGMYHFLHKRGKGNFWNMEYWSGTVDGDNSAWYVHFANGGANVNGKNYNGLVRAVRAF